MNNGQGELGTIKARTQAQSSEEASYFYILARKRQFQEKELGVSSGGAYVQSQKGDALYNYRISLRLNDKEKANKFFNEYVRLGGTLAGLKSSLKNLNPLSGLTPAQARQFQNWLGLNEQKTLELAQKFYREVLENVRGK